MEDHSDSPLAQQQSDGDLLKNTSDDQKGSCEPLDQELPKGPQHQVAEVAEVAVKGDLEECTSESNEENSDSSGTTTDPEPFDNSVLEKDYSISREETEPLAQKLPSKLKSDVVYTESAVCDWKQLVSTKSFQERRLKLLALLNAGGKGEEISQVAFANKMKDQSLVETTSRAQDSTLSLPCSSSHVSKDSASNALKLFNEDFVSHRSSSVEKAAQKDLEGDDGTAEAEEESGSVGSGLGSGSGKSFISRFYSEKEEKAFPLEELSKDGSRSSDLKLSASSLQNYKLMHPPPSTSSNNSSSDLDLNSLHVDILHQWQSQSIVLLHSMPSATNPHLMKSFLECLVQTFGSLSFVCLLSNEEIEGMHLDCLYNLAGTLEGFTFLFCPTELEKLSDAYEAMTIIAQDACERYQKDKQSIVLVCSPGRERSCVLGLTMLMIMGKSVEQAVALLNDKVKDLHPLLKSFVHSHLLSVSSLTQVHPHLLLEEEPSEDQGTCSIQ